MVMTVLCEEEHTKWQPNISEWLCPNCGMDNSEGKFYIEESMNGNCEKVHVDDWIICRECEWEGSGADFVDASIRKKNMVLKPCSCCKGTGMVLESKNYLI